MESNITKKETVNDGSSNNVEKKDINNNALRIITLGVTFFHLFNLTRTLSIAI